MRLAAALSAVALACAAPRQDVPGAPPTTDRSPAARCALGFAGACRALGRTELATDDRLAAALLMKACELGDPAGCSDLAVLHAIGRGVPQSDARAAALSRRACEQGAAIACSNQGALVADGADAGAEAGEARDARVLRLFRTACDAGIPEGCANLATALATGRLGPRDPGSAVVAHRRACEGGLRLACHRLALLLSDQRDAALDPDVRALQARSCAAGIAPACFAVGEATPSASLGTPAPRLVDDPSGFLLGIPGTGGFSPGELAPRRRHGAGRSRDEVRRPPERLVREVPPSLRARLALDLPPRETEAEDGPVELLLALRGHELGQCHEAPRVAGAPAADAYAVFLIARDGRPLDVVAATSPQDPALEACVAELVGGWEFPASGEGVTGPYLVRASFEAAPAGGPPAYAGPGSLRPAPRDPGCVERRLEVPAEYRDAVGDVTVKLAVDAAGVPSQLHALAPVPEPIRSAVARAVAGCAWSPGADADGRPATLWVTLRLSVPRR